MGVKHAAFLLVLMALSVKLNDGNYMCVQKTCYNGHKPNCLMRQNGSLLHQCTPFGKACPSAWKFFCTGGKHLTCPHQNKTYSTSTAPETPQALVQS
ncbi:uncharacterized protein LOC142587854 isoform X2 [Dermacentor variabilis]|uniref:uncharacterized protein LOC142587854 isoform X2 n=1 Tax=Dermacentor variabilis TaxID=34621 RepID=UPI003F5B2EA9